MNETGRDEIAALAVGRSGVRRRILDLLLAETGARYHLREIQRRAATTPGTASRELGRLVEAGLAERVAEGSRVYFEAGRSPLVETLRRLTGAAVPAEPQVDALAAETMHAVAATLATIYGERLVDVALAGSRACGDARPDSDVNLVVVLDRVESNGEELERTSVAIAAASLEAGVPISRLFVSAADWQAAEEAESAPLVDLRRAARS